MIMKKTIIIILLALVAMSADSQRLNKDVERIQYVYALKVVINDSVWSGFADKQYDVPLLYYGDTIPVAMWLIPRRSSWLSIRQS